MLPSPVALMPGPGGRDDLIEVAKPGLPAEQALRLGGITDQSSGVARATAAVLHRDLLARDASDGVEHLAYRVAFLTRADVEDVGGRARCQQVERLDVSIGQVRHVDVVAHASPVGGVVVGTEHGDVRPPAARRIEDEWDQMGLWVVILADLVVGISARRIKVAQRRRANGVGCAEVSKHALHHQLRRAIGIDRTLRRLL